MPKIISKEAVNPVSQRPSGQVSEYPVFDELSVTVLDIPSTFYTWFKS